MGDKFNEQLQMFVCMYGLTYLYMYVGNDYCYR